MNRLRSSFGLLSAFLLGLIGGGWLFSSIVNHKLTLFQERLTAGRVLFPAHGSARQPAPAPYFAPTSDFEKAATRSVDAVVYISTRVSDSNSTLGELFSIPDHGTGSGVILTPDGYIVTNNHVIDKAKSIKVQLNNKTEYDAELIAVDKDTDLAVIKIQPEDGESFPTLEFSDSDEVRVGQWVLAVGNPFSLTSTVTAGIVSAKARNIGIIGTLGNDRSGKGYDYAIESFIQTDAAVNPGNSGGALVSLSGELIGINTAIATETGSFAGYSFAIPSNLVRKVVSDLIEFGVVQRGFIGITIKDVDPRTARRKKLRNSQGVYVASLTKGGAAADAGLRAGDIIQSINGRAVSNTSELQEQLANYRPGHQVKLEIWRDGEQFERAVVLRNMEGKTDLIRLRTGSHSITHKAIRLGATFSDASNKDLQKLNVDYAVRVVSVADGSLLAQVGIRQGSLITKVDRQPFATYSEFIERIEAATDVIYLEAVLPSGKTEIYSIKLGETQ